MFLIPVWGWHFLIAGFLIGLDFIYYSRAREDIDMMFVINRIIFILIWEIAVLFVLYRFATGKGKVGDFKA